VASVRLEQLRQSYGSERVVDIPALAIADGEFFSLLGPSGCGKTTTLRSIAGSVQPDAGRVTIGERDVTDLPPFRRNVGMVFQKYALFPHLTVAENVAYGLEGRGLARAAMLARVAESLDLVALQGFQRPYPHQLSGGQQQRVAMARAVAYRPDVLLLDEPFSSLDVKLRSSLRVDLRRLQRTLGITTVFVTHDQQEALTLSDRLAVMNAVRIEQVGTPEAIYTSPESSFVADFVGGTNLLRGTIVAVASTGLARVDMHGRGTLTVHAPDHVHAGAAVTLMIKPERISVHGDLAAADDLVAEIVGMSYLGSGFSYVMSIGDQHIETRQPDAAMIGTRRAGIGDRLVIQVKAAAIRVVAS
jgi:putative spermidine/putrescine transport system ATP-binding protein